MIRRQLSEIGYALIGQIDIAGGDRITRLASDRFADFLQAVQRQGVGRVGIKHALIQRARALVAGESSGGKRGIGTPQLIFRCAIAGLGCMHRGLEFLHVGAATEHIGCRCKIAARSGEVVARHRHARLLDQTLADAGQTRARLIVVGVERTRGLEQFARAVTLGADEFVGGERFLTARHQIVEFGFRQQGAQAILIAPRRERSRGHHDERNGEQPAPRSTGGCWRR